MLSHCSSWHLVSSKLLRQFSDWATKTSRGLAHSRYQPASQRQCHGCLCPATLHRWSWPKDRAGTSNRFNTIFIITLTIKFLIGIYFQLKISEHHTSPPDYLTESELIGLMEKHGIGTVRASPLLLENLPFIPCRMPAYLYILRTYVSGTT